MMPIILATKTPFLALRSPIVRIDVVHREFGASKVLRLPPRVDRIAATGFAAVLQEVVDVI